MRANRETSPTSGSDWLFADVVTETKAELRERARQIHHLVSVLEDVPIQRDTTAFNCEALEHFIEKGSKGQMDMNDWDGLGRTVGSLEEGLSDKEWRAIERDKSYWKKNTIEGFFWMKKGERYRCRMHPKELAILKGLYEEQKEDLLELAKAVPEWEKELAQLRAIGPLPADIAARLNLTVDGQRKEKHEGISAEIGS